MRPLTALGVVGGAVGAVVAVLAHFLTRRPPQGYFAYAPLSESIPLHHPSFWPVLPIGIASGVVIGLVIGALLSVSGTDIRVERRSRQHDQD